MMEEIGEMNIMLLIIASILALITFILIRQSILTINILKVIESSNLETMQDVSEICEHICLMNKREWANQINQMIEYKNRLVEEERFEEVGRLNKAIEIEIRDFNKYYNE